MVLYDRFVSRAAEILRRARLDAGLTQSELAERLGVTQPAIAALERPGANPRMATVDRTLAALGQQLSPASIEPVLTRIDAVDETQLRARLALTPDERLAAFTRANTRLQRLAGGARRVA
jgi:transcriptional regulator with XRE-family HTH domain